MRQTHRKMDVSRNLFGGALSWCMILGFLHVRRPGAGVEIASTVGERSLEVASCDRTNWRELSLSGASPGLESCILHGATRLWMRNAELKPILSDVAHRTCCPSASRWIKKAASCAASFSQSGQSRLRLIASRWRTTPPLFTRPEDSLQVLNASGRWRLGSSPLCPLDTLNSEILSGRGTVRGASVRRCDVGLSASGCLRGCRSSLLRLQLRVLAPQ